MNLEKVLTIKAVDDALVIIDELRRMFPDDELRIGATQEPAYRAIRAAAETDDVEAIEAGLAVLREPRCAVMAHELLLPHRLIRDRAGVLCLWLSAGLNGDDSDSGGLRRELPV